MGSHCGSRRGRLKTRCRGDEPALSPDRYRAGHTRVGQAASDPLCARGREQWAQGGRRSAPSYARGMPTFERPVLPGTARCGQGSRRTRNRAEGRANVAPLEVGQQRLGHATLTTTQICLAEVPDAEENAALGVIGGGLSPAGFG
jgi:hypothetical protein